MVNFRQLHPNKDWVLHEDLLVPLTQVTFKGSLKLVSFTMFNQEKQNYQTPKLVLNNKVLETKKESEK